MKKFNNIESNAELISRVAQKSAEINKTVPKIKTLALADLQPHPKNTEDISDTADLELSIKNNGFTDPIEVVLMTSEMAQELNLQLGYVIVSGHRRKAAALKQGLKKVPCMIYELDSLLDIEDHLLMANAHRDSSKDPLLMFRRVKAHEDYLRRAGFDGDIGSVIGERLGISRRSVFRRLALGSLAEPLLDMIKNGDIAETTAELLCALPEDKQMEVCGILTSERENGIEFTRAFIKAAIDRCNGKEPVIQESIIEPHGEPEAVNVTATGIENETALSDDCDDDTNVGQNDEPASIPESETPPITVPEQTARFQPKPDTEHKPESNPEAIAEPEQESEPDTQATSSIPEDEGYPIDPAIVNSVIESEFEFADKRKMKQALNLLEQLEDVAGLGVIEWAELNTEDEAIDAITLIRNVVVGLAEEVSIIAETFELDGKDPEVDGFISQINQLAAKAEAMIA